MIVWDVDCVDEVRRKVIEAFIVYETFERGERAALCRIIEIPSFGVPAAVGVIATPPAEGFPVGIPVGSKCYPKGPHRGTPWIMARARFSTFDAPIPVVSMFKGVLSFKLGSGVLSHSATA